MGSVFDDIERTSDEWASSNESTYAWLNRSAKPEAAAARERLEVLYAAFPDSSKRLLRDIRHPDGKHAGAAYSGALASMLMNRHLRDLGFAVTTDEDTHGSERRPDLVGTRDDVGELVVEVTVLGTKQEFADHDWRSGVLCDAINEGIESADFLLSVQLDGELPDEFDPSPTVDAIRRQLARMGGPVRAVSSEFGETLSITCRIGDADVRIGFIPIDRSASDDSDTRIIGRYPGGGGCPNTEGRLRGKLRGKRPENYPAHVVPGKTPYVVAVGLYDMFASSRSCCRAIWGDEAIAISPMSPEKAAPFRRSNGFFGLGAHGPKHADVSGVLFMHRFSAEVWEQGMMVLEYFENPHARCPLPVSTLRPQRVFGVVEHTGDLTRLDWYTPAG